MTRAHHPLAAKVGHLLRDWRMRRRLTQLDFAGRANISTRHLSFLETGRSQPSRDMVLHLSELLEVPLRERNTLLLAAGFAPVYAERSLDDPGLALARRAVDMVLQGHEPYPAIAVNRHWELVAANRAASLLTNAVSPTLASAPVNVFRLLLHPEGLAPRIVNFFATRAHALGRLLRQIEISNDAVLAELHRELSAYPVPERDASGVHRNETLQASHELTSVVVPIQLAIPGGTLSFFSTVTMFGTPVDITLSELAIEAMYPADAITEQTLRGLAQDKKPA